MRNWTLALLLLGSTLAAYGQNATKPTTGDELKQCEKIADARKRSACFEVLARRAPQPSNAQNEQELLIKGLVKRLKDFEVNTFKDPMSAQLRNLKLAQHKSENSYALCGEVNAKNSHGGYVGFRPFIALLSLNTDGMSDLLSGYKFADDLSVPKAFFQIQENHRAAVWKAYCEDSVSSVVLVNPVVE